MRITVDTPDRMVITDRPMILAVALSAIMLILLRFAMAAASQDEWTGAAILLFPVVVVAGIAAIFIRRCDLILDRPSATAHLHNATLWGKTWLSWPLSDLAGAAVQSTRSEDAGMTFRPALVLTDGRTQPLTPVYTSGKGASRTVTAIERWLTDPATASATSP